MVLLLNCQNHQIPSSKLCAAQHCCQLLCDECMPHHAAVTHHHIVTCLNVEALKYFEDLTGYIEGKMEQLVRGVREKGFGCVFEATTSDGSFWECPSTHLDINLLVLSVLQEHKQLMASNKNFVSINQQSPQLYHPEFMRDLYNLIMHPWQHNAQIILLKLSDRVADSLVAKGFPLPRFGFRQHIVVQIQNYREQLIKKSKAPLIYNSRPQPIDLKHASSNEVDTSDCSASSHHHLTTRDSEVSPFRLPQMPLSIKIIESYEQIEETHAHSARITTPFTHNHPSVERKQQKEQKHEKQSEAAVIQQLRKLKEENVLLLEERALLKNQNISLREDNQILKEKCERMRSERKTQPSSSKKYRDADLSSELLAEIVELEAELNDNRHDLQIIIAYLNQLSLQGVIPAHDLNCKMAALRTFFIR